LIDIAHCEKNICFGGDVQKKRTRQLPRWKNSIKRGR